ncbi:MAG: Cysteine--tRNA ligase [Hyphomicrobiaceae bacterium hypho_1]
MNNNNIELYNSLTRTKECFIPLNPKNVRMYVCGPTVYDFAHIGNARPVIIFDVLFRLLRHVYGEKNVTYVRNITDVDDKINKRAAETYPDMPLNDSISLVTKKNEAQFHEDINELQVLKPSVEPRATEHISEIRKFINNLISRGNAYVAENHVLFDVCSMHSYGQLANRSLNEMEAGARIDVAPYKKNAMDFVLWKPSKKNEPSWKSPGNIEVQGRPGWHIECSAMAERHLGKVFDIHGGGIDLIFPHHENEIAQSRCAHNTDRMAQVWMHNGFLKVEGEKMSKSKGNFITIRELLKSKKFGNRIWAGPVLRTAMLTTHYRQPINLAVSALVEAERAFTRWAKIHRNYGIKATPSLSGKISRHLRNDLNTPGVFAELHSLANAAEKGSSLAALELSVNARFLGICLDKNVEVQHKIGISDKEIHQYIEARGAARRKKDWLEADRIRDKLKTLGVRLKDNKDPSTGEVTTTWEAI